MATPGQRLPSSILISLYVSFFSAPNAYPTLFHCMFLSSQLQTLNPLHPYFIVCFFFPATNYYPPLSLFHCMFLSSQLQTLNWLHPYFIVCFFLLSSKRLTHSILISLYVSFFPASNCYPPPSLFHCIFLSSQLQFVTLLHLYFILCFFLLSSKCLLHSIFLFCSNVLSSLVVSSHSYFLQRFFFSYWTSRFSPADYFGTNRR